MNKRIIELERHAHQLAQEAVDQKKYNTYFEYQQSLSDQSYAKFAQLIVQECGNWIVENAGAMEHLGPDYFAKAMTKDFGVEL
jgi:hypothetical protein